MALSSTRYVFLSLLRHEPIHGDARLGVSPRWPFYGLAKNARRNSNRFDERDSKSLFMFDETSLTGKSCFFLQKKDILFYTRSEKCACERLLWEHWKYLPQVSSWSASYRSYNYLIIPYFVTSYLSFPSKLQFPRILLTSNCLYLSRGSRAGTSSSSSRKYGYRGFTTTFSSCSFSPPPSEGRSMKYGTRKVSGSGVEGKKNGFKFRARNELTTKRKSRKESAKGRYRARRATQLNDARSSREMISAWSRRCDDYSSSLSNRAFLPVSRRFFRDDISRAISLCSFCSSFSHSLFRPPPLLFSFWHTWSKRPSHFFLFKLGSYIIDRLDDSLIHLTGIFLKSSRQNDARLYEYVWKYRCTYISLVSRKHRWSHDY